MLRKRPRTTASGLNPSFSPKDSLAKRETELFRSGHLILVSGLIRSTPTTRKAARALRLLIRRFRVVNGLRVTAAAGLDSRHSARVSRAEKISCFGWLITHPVKTGRQQLVRAPEE